MQRHSIGFGAELTVDARAEPESPPLVPPAISPPGSPAPGRTVANSTFIGLDVSGELCVYSSVSPSR